MKKGLLLLFIVISLVQAVSAEMILDDFKSSVYNKGEELLISGTILRDTAVKGGSLDFTLVCGELEFQLLEKTINIKAKTTETFKIEDLRVPPPAEGTCHVEVALFDETSETLFEEESSESFEVSDELKAEGDFQVNPIQVQLGSTLTLYGSITSLRADASQFAGSANIYFKNEDKIYYANNVDISEGTLEYSYDVKDNKPGEYFIDILVEDLYGNEKIFKDVAQFNIVDEVHIFVEPIQSKLSPGNIVPISGKVSTILGEQINKGTLQIVLENEIYNADIREGEFNYDLKLPEDIDAGKHQLLFSFSEQKTKNWGSTEKTIYIDVIPKDIKLITFQESIKPEELLDFTVFAHDQAGDEIEGNANIELIDPDGKSVYLESVKLGEKTSIEIPRYSVPGGWKLKATYSSLESQQGLTIEEVKTVEVELLDEKIYIKNTGNVEYDEPVSIDLDNGGYVFTKKVSIEPEETYILDLTKEAPSGQHDIKVSGAAITGAAITGMAGSQFEDVVIEGKNKRSFNFIYSVLLVFLVASLAYLSIFKKRHFADVKIRKQRDVEYAQLKLKKLKAMKAKEAARRPTFTREQSIADFRRRMLKDIGEAEEKAKRNSFNSNSFKPRNLYSKSEEKKEDEPSGLFNMFG